MIPKIFNAHDISALCILSVEQLDLRAQEAIDQAQQELQQFLLLDNTHRTFNNTARQLDRITGTFEVTATLMHVIEAVHPHEQMRNAAHHNALKLHAFAVDNFWQNQKVYQAFTAYAFANALTEKLTDEQRYFIDQELLFFQRNGLHLSEQIQERLKNIHKELGEHTLSFERAIAADTRTIIVDKNNLIGLSDSFLSSLRKTPTGDYILGVDYPTYFEVMENCSVESTRRALWKEFVNRAYPTNNEELAQIIALRDELARIVGYKSFAHLDISDQMAKSPEAVETFLHDLLQRSGQKLAQEMDMLKSAMPQECTLTETQRFKPWDLGYIKAYYKKKYLSVDEDVIAQYFPLEHTIDQLLRIYQEFFGLSFKKSHLNNLWHEHVEYITVHKDNKLIGSLLLDLYPRPGKFTHACHINIVPTITNQEGEHWPALSLVIANFPWPALGQPALLKRTDVITFFHEFGHALHGLLGSTELIAFSGTRVKRDFVEMPSQMLEEWMWQPQVLTSISKHYKTGEPLPENLVNNIIALKHFDSGYWLQRQIFYSLLALNYFKAGAYKNIDQIHEQLYKKILTYIEFYDDNHDYAAFGHLTGYGAKYYGYVWSRVFAADLFNYIKSHCLSNSAMGAQYSNEILKPGGSIDPYDILRTFLGREPDSQAFLKDMGI